MPSFQFFVLAVLPILGNASPINRQVGISENVFMTTQNGTDGLEQRVCSIDAVTYMDGETIPTSSPCEHCVCRPPGFACTITSCEYRPGCKAFRRSDQCCPEYQCECEKDGKIYQNGERIMDNNNPCEMCYCQGGEIICAVMDCYWRNDCPPRYIDNRCCPMYDHCPPPAAQGPIRHRLPTPTSPIPISLFNLTQLSSSTQASASSEVETSSQSSTTTTTTTAEESSSSVNPEENSVLPDLTVKGGENEPVQGDVAATPESTEPSLSDDSQTELPSESSIHATPSLSGAPVDSTTMIVPAALELLVVKPTNVQKTEIHGYATVTLDDVPAETTQNEGLQDAPESITSSSIPEVLHDSADNTETTERLADATETVPPMEQEILADAVPEAVTQGLIRDAAEQEASTAAAQNDEPTDAPAQNDDVPVTTYSSDLDDSRNDLVRNDLFESSTDSNLRDEIPSTGAPETNAVYQDGVGGTTPGVILDDDETHNDDIESHSHFADVVPTASNLVLDDAPASASATVSPLVHDDPATEVSNDDFTTAAQRIFNDGVTESAAVVHDDATEAVSAVHDATEQEAFVHDDATEAVSDSATESNFVVHDEATDAPSVVHDDATEAAAFVHDDSTDTPSVVHDDATEVSGLFHDDATDAPSVVHNDATEASGLLHDDATEAPAVAHDDTTDASGLFHDEPATETNRIAFDDATEKVNEVHDDPVTEGTLVAHSDDAATEVIRDESVTESAASAQNDATEKIFDDDAPAPTQAFIRDATENVQILNDEPTEKLYVREEVDDDVEVSTRSQMVDDEVATESSAQQIHDEAVTENSAQVIQDEGEAVTEGRNQIAYDDAIVEGSGQSDDQAELEGSGHSHDQAQVEGSGQLQDETETEGSGQGNEFFHDETVSEGSGQGSIMALQDDAVAEGSGQGQLAHDETVTEGSYQIVHDEPETEGSGQLVQDDDAVTEGIVRAQPVQDEAVTESNSNLHIVHDEAATETVQIQQDEPTERTAADEVPTASPSVFSERVNSPESPVRPEENEVFDIILNDEVIPSEPETLNLVREQPAHEQNAIVAESTNQDLGSVIEETSNADNDTLEIMKLSVQTAETTQPPQNQVQNDDPQSAPQTPTQQTNVLLDDVESSTGANNALPLSDKGAVSPTEQSASAGQIYNDEPTERLSSLFRDGLSEIFRHHLGVPHEDETTTAAPNAVAEEELVNNDEPVSTSVYNDDPAATTQQPSALYSRNKVQKVAEALAQNNQIHSLGSEELPLHKFRLDLDTFRASYEIEEDNEVVQQSKDAPVTTQTPVQTANERLNDEESQQTTVQPGQEGSEILADEGVQTTQSSSAGLRDEAINSEVESATERRVFDAAQQEESTGRNSFRAEEITTETALEDESEGSGDQSQTEVGHDEPVQTTTRSLHDLSNGNENEIEERDAVTNSYSFRMEIMNSMEEGENEVHDNISPTQVPQRLNDDPTASTESSHVLRDESSAATESVLALSDDPEAPTESAQVLNDDVAATTEAVQYLRSDINFDANTESAQVLNDDSAAATESVQAFHDDSATDSTQILNDDAGTTNAPQFFRADLDISTESTKALNDDVAVTTEAVQYLRSGVNFDANTEPAQALHDDVAATTEAVQYLRSDINFDANTESSQVFNDESAAATESVQDDSPAATESVNVLRDETPAATESNQISHDEPVTSSYSNDVIQDDAATQPPNRFRLDLDFETEAPSVPLNDEQAQPTAAPEAHDYLEVSTESPSGFAQVFHDDESSTQAEPLARNDEIQINQDESVTSLPQQDDSDATEVPSRDISHDETVLNAEIVTSSIPSVSNLVRDEPATNSPQLSQNDEPANTVAPPAQVLGDAGEPLHDDDNSEPATETPSNDEPVTGGNARSGLDELLLDDEVNSTPSNAVVFADEPASTVQPVERLRTEPVPLNDEPTENNEILHDGSPTESQQNDEPEVSTISSVESQTNSTTNSPSLKAKKEEVILPETGLPKIQPISPDLSRNNPNKLRFDLNIPSEKDGSWLSRAVNQFRRMAGFSSGTEEEKPKPNSSYRVRENTRRFLFF